VVEQPSPLTPLLSKERGIETSSILSDTTFIDGEIEKRILPPKFCPSCGSEVKKDENKVRYYCPNKLDCPAQHIEKLIFAI
jgi:NAD-dependent DNA ligase